MTSGNYQTGSNKLYWVKENLLAKGFPDINQALRDPDGLLAIGGDLSAKRLLDAYRCGIFPWFNEGQPILWWSPNPRCILEPKELKISRSLAKLLRKDKFKITYNTAFTDVLEGCAAVRKDIDDTWITNDIKLAYINLFNMHILLNVGKMKNLLVVYMVSPWERFFLASPCSTVNQMHQK